MKCASVASDDTTRILRDPFVHRILGRALDRLDSRPAAERTHAVRLNIDAELAPEIYDADSLNTREVAWARIDGLATSGILRIGYRLHRRHGSREERRPYIDIDWSDSTEDAVRAALARPRKAPSYSARWRSLLELHDPPLPPATVAKLSASPIELGRRPIDEVFARFLSIRDMVGEPLLLREVSSRVFWGLSKILDGRGDVVAALLELDECPFPEQPIILNVHLRRTPSSFLFVENHVSFERLRRRTDLVDTALIYSSGFRGAAQRLRKEQGVSIYYSRDSSPGAMTDFEIALFSMPDVTTFFWGDLDYSGMAILSALRSTFPGAEAWRPGYGPMVERLARGEGHSPSESGKERQRPIDSTGCIYADNELIPTLRATQRFLDQE
ncbi:DUF2220 family protein [Bradyrhizobium sp. CB82]|uniref:Wadjet anti-phage system protein JetD domain-containing protein n=1 Tax=Bradyrhizobium sp. CB82 TaxID=3039159 RepID=UPI0024B114F2|nr:Wadjet anti-phage system protein JetD domain-containing protein [Bradyrhizobium sp. CB82]WFU40780.1 DUF2220 family protein [Bradyrhizobium sp. CB82]